MTPEQKKDWRKHIEAIKDAMADAILANKLDAAYEAFQKSENETAINAAIRDALADYDARMNPYNNQ